MSKKIFLSPSDQTGNAYAVGDTAEDVVCGKLALAAKTALVRNGFKVDMAQYTTMSQKCAASDALGADLHVPIHTNAFNGSVSGTRIFYYADGGNGHKAAKAILARLGPVTPGTPDLVQADASLYEVRVPRAPTAYIEVDFHDVPSVASWLIAHTVECGEMICAGICDYFGIKYTAPEEEAKAAEEASLQAQFEALLAAHEKQLQDNDAGVWSENARNWAVATGLINGIGKLPDGTANYAWESHMTREQLVTVLYRFATAIGAI